MVLALALAALRLPAPAAADGKAAPRDWKACPAVVEVDTDQEVYALGDVHGDYERLITLLVAAKVIPEDPGKPHQVRWSAGKAVLVCTGDLIDKGEHSLAVVRLFRALQAEADKGGGRVILTLGNHEAEFLADPAGDKTAEFAAELKAHALEPADVAAGTDKEGVGAFLRSLPAAARVNDWFFVHAGNTHGLSLDKLRTALQAAIDRDGYRTPILLDKDSLLEARMQQPRPWWEKEGDDEAKSKERLAECVGALGVKHLVVGHQPGKVVFGGASKRHAGELAEHFDGLLFLIDVGMSRKIGHSNGALLLIRRDKKTTATVVFPDGKTSALWAEK
jgi:hypothetical protein